MVTILNHIYEEDFLGFSYGFRPGRSQHQALDALSYALVKKKVNYVLDAAIQGFFDNLDKAWMRLWFASAVLPPRFQPFSDRSTGDGFPGQSRQPVDGSSETQQGTA